MTTYATWNPADKNANIVLSNGNLTAGSSIAAHKGVRATVSKSSGKWYWEISIDNRTSTYSIGIGTSSASLSSQVGSDLYGYGYFHDGRTRHDGAYTLYGIGYTTGDVIGVALDMDNGKIWWSINGTWQNSGDPANGTNPAYTGISGVFFPQSSLFALADQFTANFGASAFTYSVPSGFNSGLYDGGVEEAELVDASLDLAAYYRKSQDLASFLRAHDGVELYNLIAKLEAADWNVEDLKSFFSAYYQDVKDAGMDLSTWGTHYDDLESFLAAHFQHLEDMKAGLETWATGYGDHRTVLEAADWSTEDLSQWLCAWGQDLTFLGAVLRAVKYRFGNLSAFLSATDGLVTGDLGCFLKATDGAVRRDLGLYLKAVRSIPAFRTVTAQKVSAVVHEVN